MKNSNDNFLLYWIICGWMWEKLKDLGLVLLYITVVAVGIWLFLVLTSTVFYFLGGVPG